MKTEVSSISTARRRVTVDVPPGEVDRIFDRVLREYRRSLSVPGFRKGKAPMAVVRQRVGSSLGSTVAESIVDTYAQKAIESEGVAPIAGSVAMELDDGADALPA
ncbi:MAG: trigger factor family protein, partial [Acidobacteriota bacterium]|nr:trigger factor family protein [Acidobacteriota bacterium]